MNSRSFHGMMVPIIESAHSLLGQLGAFPSGFTLFYYLKNLLYQLLYTILQHSQHLKILLFYYFIKILFFNLPLLFISNVQPKPPKTTSCRSEPATQKKKKKTTSSG